MPIRISGDVSARSSSTRISEDDQEHQRDDHLVVAVRRGLGVEVERRPTADQGVGTVDGVHLRRAPSSTMSKAGSEARSYLIGTSK